MALSVHGLGGIRIFDKPCAHPLPHVHDFVMRDVEQTPRLVHMLPSPWICCLEPNEHHESLAEILLAHDIADAGFSFPWTTARFVHVQLMEPTGHMHHDADGDVLKERVEAADRSIPTRVHEFDGCLHVQAVCNGRPLRLGCHGDDAKLDDR